MRRSFLVLALATCAVMLTAACKGPAHAAETVPRAEHRIVIEVNVEGADRWEGILNNVDNLQRALGVSRTTVEVVAHAKGLGLLLLATNELLEARMRAEHDSGVIFVACENTMKKQNVTRDQLMPFATTVDSGVAEVVRKQEAGWSYLKGGG